jgi:hypothetical protein
MSTLSNGKNLSGFDGGGEESIPAPTTGFVTLDVDDHYFPIMGEEDADLLSIQIVPGAAIAGVFTVESCNLPSKRNGTGPDDVTLYNETAGYWIKEDPSTAYVATIGSGWSVSNLTLTRTAAAGGGAMIHLGNVGARRLRVKAAITTGGTVRIIAHGKYAR